jgi:hypothetical protein
MKRRSLFAALGLACGLACAPPTPPAPPPMPDASDAAPAPPATVLGDAAPGTCAYACEALMAAGCPEGASAMCLPTLASADSTREVATPAGHPLTCAAISVVHSASDARALGIACAGGH